MKTKGTGVWQLMRVSKISGLNWFNWDASEPQTLCDHPVCDFFFLNSPSNCPSAPCRLPWLLQAVFTLRFKVFYFGCSSLA